jgi:sugar/nucleoside kinase (ribokinase family)
VAIDRQEDEVHDVFAYGVIAPSTLVELPGGYPPEAGYAEIGRIRTSIGGEAAGSAFVLARLGVSTKLTGTRLADEPATREALRILEEAGVDCGDIDLDAPRSVTEIVMSTPAERTIFATYGSMLADRMWAPPSREDVASSRMVCLDPFFGEESERVARWCAEDRIPYVTVDVAPATAIARQAAAIVISHEFAGTADGSPEAHEIVKSYSEHSDGLVVLTQGEGSIAFGRRGEEVHHQEPFEVDVIDTAGAGDAFRAGVIHGLMNDLTDADVIRNAAAIAGIVCRSSPGVLGSPTTEELADFLGP